MWWRNQHCKLEYFFVIGTWRSSDLEENCQIIQFSFMCPWSKLMVFFWSSLFTAAVRILHGSKRLYRQDRYRRLQLQTFEVWSRRLLSTWFIFAQQNIRGNNFKTLRIISGGKCVVSEQEIIMPKSWQKRNMNGTRWSKTCKQLSFGATVSFNGCQTANVWRHLDE